MLSSRFQSPSLRGSGRFALRRALPALPPERFNPLHCGAVVAFVTGGGVHPARSKFQSPSLRGSGRLNRPSAASNWRWHVSIPFIAGQWSLGWDGSPKGLSSPDVSIPFIAGQWSLRAPLHARRRRSACFNPLHCGAVVACGGADRRRRRARRVSIPFIAGQWSLAGWTPPPSAEGGVSIPFIAGQWSLCRRGSNATCFGNRFQSPSLRGSGRLSRASPATREPNRGFNPLHCGAVVAFEARVDIAQRVDGFNPLHCGAVVACLRRGRRMAGVAKFQSPSLRGSGRLTYEPEYS